MIILPDTGLDLRRFIPCFPAFFGLLISLCQLGLLILLLKSGSNLGPRRVIPCSTIKLPEFSF